MRWACRVAIAIIAVLAGCAGAGGRAAAKDGSAQFDRPLTVRRLPPGTGANPAPEVICTLYPDLMIRETGTDTPAPEAADLVRRPPGAACGRGALAGAVGLDTQGYSFAGRKGPFLLFTATDPNGAVPFTVIDAATGRVIHRDGLAAGTTFHAVVRGGGTLTLDFTRGVNAPCALPKDGAACWARLGREGLIPPDLARRPPPMTACAAAYHTEKAPPDDPSVLAYDVDLRLQAAGAVQTRLTGGRVACTPLP